MHSRENKIMLLGFILKLLGFLLEDLGANVTSEELMMEAEELVTKDTYKARIEVEHNLGNAGVHIIEIIV